MQMHWEKEGLAVIHLQAEGDGILGIMIVSARELWDSKGRIELDIPISISRQFR
jgi:hypothetical protein